MNFIGCTNLNKDLPNPYNFYKFNCTTITDVCLKSHTFFQYLGAKPFLTKKKDYHLFIILAFVGYDGFLRIFDYNRINPLLSFKSHFGGFQCIKFSEDCELIGLGG